MCTHCHHNNSKTTSDLTFQKKEHYLSINLLLPEISIFIIITIKKQKQMKSPEKMN